jgi:hypothetical protein
MRDLHRSKFLSVLTLSALATALLLTLASPALAYTDEPTQTTLSDGDGPEGVDIEDDATEGDETDEEGVEGEGVDEGEGTESELGIVPAATIPPAADDTLEQPWTQRFLAPTVLILGVLGLIGAVAYYGMRVKGRYRVVD